MCEMCAPHYFGRSVVRCERLAKRRRAPRWTVKSGRLPIHPGLYQFVCTSTTHWLYSFDRSTLSFILGNFSRILFKLNGLFLNAFLSKSSNYPYAPTTHYKNPQKSSLKKLNFLYIYIQNPQTPYQHPLNFLLFHG